MLFYQLFPLFYCIIYLSLLIHFMSDEYVSYFQFRFIVNKDAIYMYIKVLCKYRLSFHVGKYGNACLYGKNDSLLYNKLSNSFPKWLYHFAFPLSIHESFSYLAFCPSLVIISFLILFQLFSH